MFEVLFSHQMTNIIERMTTDDKNERYKCGILNIKIRYEEKYGKVLEPFSRKNG